MINRDIFLQYVYDLGFENACKTFDMTTEKARLLIDPIKSEEVYYERKMLKKRASKNELIESCINKNYNLFKREFVKDTSKISISKNVEDLFHDALTALLEDHNTFTCSVEDYIRFKIGAYIQRHVADTKSYLKVMDNTDNYDFELNNTEDANT